MDVESFKRWYDYSKARDLMLEHTDIGHAPWYIVDLERQEARPPERHLAHPVAHPLQEASSTRRSSCRSGRPRRSTTIMRPWRRESTSRRSSDAHGSAAAVDEGYGGRSIRLDVIAGLSLAAFAIPEFARLRLPRGPSADLGPLLLSGGGHRLRLVRHQPAACGRPDIGAGNRGRRQHRRVGRRRHGEGRCARLGHRAAGWADRRRRAISRPG